MRFILALLFASCAHAMVIDPVDPSFGFAIEPLVEGAYGGRPDLHRIVPLADGRVAALATIPGDRQGCLTVTLLVFDGAGRLSSRWHGERMGLPPCMDVDAIGLAVAADGAFLIAGAPSYEAEGATRVWKVGHDGTPETAFGTSGAAVVPGLSTLYRAHVEALPDGTVAVGGTARVPRGAGSHEVAWAVVHLRPDGRPDASFGVGGVAIAVPPNRPVHGRDGGGMAHLADGSVLLAGNIFEDDAGAKIYTDAAVVRFDARGQVDTSYGVDGFALPLADASTYVQSLAVRDGEAYLAGIVNRDVPVAFVTKVTKAGKIDLAFGDAGIAGIYDFVDTFFDPLVAVDGSARVYLSLVSRFHRKVLRFTAQGTPDATFGLAGGAYLDPPGWIYLGRGELAIDARDRVYFGAGAGPEDGLPDSIVLTRLGPAGGHREGVGGGTAVVYYHGALDHYFLTADPEEQALLDSGVTKGWQRTGQDFRVVTTADADLVPVCRYYGRPEAHLDSHFFSAAADECAAVGVKFGASWLLETDAAFHVHPADRTTGACPRGSERVYRAFNGRPDANHYYGVAPAAPAGWIYEGYGPASRPTAFCAPLL